jgi:prepilin-type N-terminal cleavage/methylation domain-containing protein
MVALPYKKNNSGFTLIEIVVVITLIGILATAGMSFYNEARKQARDDRRAADLLQLQIAIEAYKDVYGTYPASGCSAATSEFAGPGPVNGTVPNLVSCDDYITGLVDDFIGVLPVDPVDEGEINRGVYYRSDGTSYKLMYRNVVESKYVDGYADRLSRCPYQPGVGQCSTGVSSTTYAVYSAGAEEW